MKLRLTSKQRILKMLRKYRRGVTNHQFHREFIFEYRTRISELRKTGLCIVCERMKAGEYRYTLIP